MGGFVKGFAVLVWQNFSRDLFLCAYMFVKFDFPSKISGDCSCSDSVMNMSVYLCNFTIRVILGVQFPCLSGQHFLHHLTFCDQSLCVGVLSLAQGCLTSVLWPAWNMSNEHLFLIQSKTLCTFFAKMASSKRLLQITKCVCTSPKLGFSKSLLTQTCTFIRFGSVYFVMKLKL